VASHRQNPARTTAGLLGNVARRRGNCFQDEVRETGSANEILQGMVDRPGTACLDGAPSSRVWLRLCERFGCGHVFGLLAREANVPLALMLVRMALRPISKTRS